MRLAAFRNGAFVVRNFRGDRGAMASGNGSAEWHEESVRVDDLDLVIVKGGNGKPLLILHEELGWPGFLVHNIPDSTAHLARSG